LRALGSDDPSTGTPLISSLMASALKDLDEYPLNEFLRDDREHTCDQGCYRCLLRYRNQPHHSETRLDSKVAHCGCAVRPTGFGGSGPAY
jgi:hypothetical protein